VDASSNQLSVGTSSGSASWDLVVDVYRLAQATEVVACEISNLGSKAVTVQGQAIPPNASRSVEVTLPVVQTPAWTPVRFSAADFGKLATRGCRIRTPSTSTPTKAPSRAVLR